MNRIALIPLAVLSFCGSVGIQAEPPTLDYIFPAGGEQGTTVTLTLGGKLNPWPVKIWSSCMDLVFKPQEKKGEVAVQIPKGTPTGPHLIRIYNDDGTAKPRSFLVGRIAETMVAESKEEDRPPQKIEAAPVVLNGRLERQGDADSFAILLKAGQWLVASMNAYGIGSPIDPTLHLKDAQGNRITEALDTQNLDPLLAYRAESDGTFILQVDAFAHPPRFDVRLFGSPASVYRLSIHTGAFAHYTLPMAAQVGTKPRIELCGWNLRPDATGGSTADIDATIIPPHCLALFAVAPLAENEIAIPISTCPQSLESEGNNTRETAQRLDHPFGVTGRICPKGDEDWYALDLKKDEQIRFALRSATLGFPLDPVLTLQSPEGKVLASNDDAEGTWDSTLTWKATKDEACYLQVMDRYQMGGDDFAYYLEAFAPQPGVKALVEKDALWIDTGTTTSLKLTVTRTDGYNDPMIASAVDLPDGVSSTSAAVPDKGGEVLLILSAAQTAKPYSGLFRALVFSTNPDSPRVCAGSASLDVELPVGRQLIERTELLWLTVAPPPPKTPPAAPTG